MPPPPVDLKKVGELFEETLAAIRDGTPDNEALEPQALAWLKDARYKIMRQVEASYYKLARSRDAPLSQPIWVNPSRSLYLRTDPIPTILIPYVHLFSANLVTLMKDCGFQDCSPVDSMNQLSLVIRFPIRPRVAQDPPVLPEILHVEDEFSGMAEGGCKPINGGFSATDFGRLLISARGEGTDGNGDEDGVGNPSNPSPNS
ncbi:hypothetical protein C8R44DRAFT_798620 [Mycena epipterygia]|nr:hypothetical protein C8R44DRAFT_798620 [Mycena epipterygia]